VRACDRWCGVALSASLANGHARAAWAWLSPAFTAFLLLKVSGAPMVDKAGKRKWGGDPRYDEYVAKTSSLVPWFPAELPAVARKVY